MLKHVSVSPWRGRSDSVSLASSGGSTSSCGSGGTPSPGHTPPPSRASSCASLAIPLNGLSSFISVNSIANNGANSQPSQLLLHHHQQEAPQQTTIKVYANCLRTDIEYKTLSITYETTCREVVQNLLNKFKMRHRDPRLFYLTMEVTVRRANVRTVLPLDEDARPAVLQSCHPKGDSKFALQTRRGGLVKIYDSAIMPASKYKSLLVSEQTTVDELIQMLLSCYNSTERVELFSLYEVSEGEEYQRKLHPDDLPLQVTQRWTSGDDRHLRIRRNPDYLPNPQRRKSMWASDSSITLAMSMVHLQSPPAALANNTHHHHHFFNHQSNKNRLIYNRPHNHLHHHHHHHHHPDCNNNKQKQQQQQQQQQHQQQQQQQQLIMVQSPQGLKSLPTTPVAQKHISTTSYADYENYLYI
ncbi:nuclear transcription factor Y subunit gamma [Trichogramma pretiosum]|uniref:nuclear transcription factor Y subunit gamma n=1 Tax=Trichogramma pretiosum TaxID=7493 RepID=UPI0006C96B04|nr:nuclear transcription factor Y subunit gamma [Trichogramma pretiosum]